MARRKDDPQFGAPARGKEATARQPSGRVCAQDGCKPVLSTYNKADRCSVHDEPRFRHALYPG
jgi:hypothetical protein